MRFAGTALSNKRPWGMPSWPGLAVLSAVLAWTGLFLFVAPAPLMAGYAKAGRVWAKVLVTVGLVATMLFFDRAAGVVFVVFVWVPAFLAVWYLRGRMDLHLLMTALTGYGLFLAAVLGGLKVLAGWDVAEFLLLRFNEALDMAVGRWSGRPGWTWAEADVALMRETVAVVLRRYGVSLLFWSVVGTAVLNLLLALVFLRDGYSPRSVRSDFSAWRTDFSVMLLLLAFWIGALGGAFLDRPVLRDLCLNGMMVAGFFYFLQGVAVVATWLARMPGSVTLKAVLVFLLLQFVPALVWLTVLFGFGLLDEWFRFRDINLPSGGDEA